MADARAGRSLDYFVNHPNSRKAQLLLENVVAIRLYTTAAYMQRARTRNLPIHARACRWLPETRAD
jgi:hypothetical protein